MSKLLSLASVQFSSVPQLCLTLCDPMDCSMDFATPCPSPAPKVYSNSCPLSQWCHQLSHLLSTLLLLHSIFPSIRVFSSESVHCIRWKSIVVSALTSVLPMNIQDWFSLGLTGFILQSKELSKVFSSTTVQKHQFFGTQPFLWSNSYIHTRLLEKP